jgi:hypothetical protein
LKTAKVESEAGAHTAADGAVVPSTPKRLSGLVLWLDDTVGIVQEPSKPEQVKRWIDQSGQGNDATAQCTNGCPGDLLNLDPAAVNGRGAVTCKSNSGNGAGLIWPQVTQSSVSPQIGSSLVTARSPTPPRFVTSWRGGPPCT